MFVRENGSQFYVRSITIWGNLLLLPLYLMIHSYISQRKRRRKRPPNYSKGKPTWNVVPKLPIDGCHGHCVQSPSFRIRSAQMVPNEVVHHGFRQGQVVRLWHHRRLRSDALHLLLPYLFTQTFHVYLVVHPFHPACVLRVAIDQDQPVHHRWSPSRQPYQNVGSKADAETNAMGYAKIVHCIFHLSG